MQNEPTCQSGRPCRIFIVGFDKLHHSRNVTERFSEVICDINNHRGRVPPVPWRQAIMQPDDKRLALQCIRALASIFTDFGVLQLCVCFLAS